ncbi:MAG: xanthine dehydrogenase family protein molybdopterin-binding subunit, partial [Acidobacteria bacterium]|nr:xanthine dehydrogenase family protein molybdopterin-binding subunit [Acidobacteriota bacterium]
MVDAPPQPLAARFVGSSVIRKEDRRLVTGHGRYVDDVTLRDQLHLAFRRSDVAKGKITRLDVSAAEALPGVVAVFTGETMNPHHGEAWHGMLGEGLATPPPLAMGSVKHVGDPVACVVAESRYIAEDACDLIEIDYDVETPAVDYRTAAADTEHIVHGDWGLKSNAMVDVPFTPMSADLEEAFANAAHVVELEVDQNRYICVPMEARGVNASWDAGNSELHLTLSGQSTHSSRDYYSRYLAVPESSITVEMRDVGGGFGQKMFVFREENAT